MKIAIYSPNGTLTDREGSHRTAWAYMRADQIARQGNDVTVIYTKNEETTDWSQYDQILVYLGMEWSGVLNLFGGASDENLDKFLRLSSFKDRLAWLDVRPEGLGDLVASRWPIFDGAALNARAQSAPVARQTFKEYQIIGDSHSLNWYTPGASVNRNDGKTLHGALKDGLESYLEGNPKKIAVCFGNIDIRHHLLRQSDPKESVETMLDDMQSQLRRIQEKYGCDIEIVQPLPIEDESRKLPKTGWYKGAPFFGSWHSRNEIRNFMDSLLKLMAINRGWKYLTYPDYFTDEAGKLRFEMMEKPGSVHISWEHGRMNRALRGENWV